MPTLSELLPAMLEKTLNAKLDWEQLSTTSFITRIGATSLEASRRADGNIVLSLRREDGNVVESVNYQGLPSGLDKTLLTLYDAARRRALGVDSLLSTLKSELDKL